VVQSTASGTVVLVVLVGSAVTATFGVDLLYPNNLDLYSA